MRIWILENSLASKKKIGGYQFMEKSIQN